MIIEVSTYEERYRRLSYWHPFFAALPAPVEGGYAWLQFVERRATPVSLVEHGGMVFEYRTGRRVGDAVPRWRVLVSLGLICLLTMLLAVTL